MSRTKYYIMDGPSISYLVHIATLHDDDEYAVIRELNQYDSETTVYSTNDDDITSIKTFGTIEELSTMLKHLDFDDDLDNLSYAEKHYTGTIKFNDRKSVFAELTTVYSKPGDFIEVTEWTNGEGYDITISDDKQISLTDMELDVINLVISKLRD